MPFRWSNGRDCAQKRAIPCPESKLVDVLEGMREVVAYAKNQGLNFKIPYTLEGRAGNYVPDFLIRFRDGLSTGSDDLLTLVLEEVDRGLFHATHTTIHGWRRGRTHPTPVSSGYDTGMADLNHPRDPARLRTRGSVRLTGLE